MFGVPLELIKFQSTLPLRGATHYHYKGPLWPGISIHAPLTGSDSLSATCCLRWTNFNPRSPYGERQLAGAKCFGLINFNPRSPYGERPRAALARVSGARFQSTLPLRGATATGLHCATEKAISIHAPLTGSDGPGARASSPLPNFNPRSPYGERHGLQALGLQPCAISIHAPLTGSDLFLSALVPPGRDFNPRSPYGERQVLLWY